jgi:UDP-N-acetylmuramate dehydrogenase
MDIFLNKRINSQPLNLPNAGSTFKRPKNGYASELIDRAGLKGFYIGDAEISSKHAGFIVNKGNATSNDVNALIIMIKKIVIDELGN